MTHLTDDIPRLLTGDATREEVLAAAEHLRSCPDCQQELVSAVVAHASLTSAQRFAPEIVTPVPALDEDEPDGPLPDMSALFAQARAEAAGTAAPPARNRRWRTAALAAAAAVVIGGTAAGVVELSTSSSSPSGTRVALAAFQAGKAPAEARVVDRTMRIDATKLPRLDPQHFYEVWLTDKQRQHMWPLGAIGSDNKAQLPVPTSVMSRYAAIEVSVQRANETGYSGVSVLRGTYG
jgi:Anti-sigma-K factor rskA